MNKDIKEGDLIVSGDSLIHLVGEVLCEHIIHIRNYHEINTKAETLEFVGYVPVWRKLNDKDDASGKKAGAGLHIVKSLK